MCFTFVYIVNCRPQFHLLIPFSKLSEWVFSWNHFQNPPQQYFSLWGCVIHSAIRKWLAKSVLSININDSVTVTSKDCDVGNIQRTEDKILEHSHFCRIAKSWRCRIRSWCEITNQEWQEFSRSRRVAPAVACFDAPPTIYTHALVTEAERDARHGIWLKHLSSVSEGGGG